MPLRDIFRISALKGELEQAQYQRTSLQTELELWKQKCSSLKAILSDTEHMEYSALKQVINELGLRKAEILKEATQLDIDLEAKQRDVSREVAELEQQLQSKRQEIIVQDDQILLQTAGFYQPKYEFANSELYRAKLTEIRLNQEAMIKAGTAAYGSLAWTVNNSQREGERMTKDYAKLILRSFNNECDVTIMAVKYSNVESATKKITKAYEVLNNLGKRMYISISAEYLDLKLQELHLAYEYQVKKQEEKEEQRRVREQMKEEAKLLREIEEAKLKLGKEEKHFTRALEAIEVQLARSAGQAERAMLEQEKANIQQSLAQLEHDKLDIQRREQNTRAGYVYIISNIGSFGENVYKIGVTRRLEPQERVDELGDASVPFEFDVHALIFSEDAPALENALHKAFEHKRLNMINRRREFFCVTLEEIEQVVKRNFNKPVEFTDLAEASQYRQSIVIWRRLFPQGEAQAIEVNA